MGAGHNQIKRGFVHLVNRWVQHIGVIDPANTGGGNGPKERHTRQCQGCRCANHRGDIRVIFHIMRQNGTDNLCLAFK